MKNDERMEEVSFVSQETSYHLTDAFGEGNVSKECSEQKATGEYHG